MHYVIFIPDAEGYDAAGQLADVGLGKLVDKYVGPASENCTLGEHDGRLIRFDDVSRPDRNATPGVDDKTWWWDHKRTYAIGWLAEAPPCPNDLQRNERYTDDPLLTSFRCTLQDEQIWLVPVARQLPQDWMQCPETGRPILGPKHQYAWYFDEVRDMVARMASGEITPETVPVECFDLAIKALATNYRICPEVVFALRLFDRADAAKVVMAAAEFSVEFKAHTHWEVRMDNPILTQKKTGRLASATAT